MPRLFAVAGAVTFALSAHIASIAAAPGEPDLNTALTWWSEAPNRWTPVGWKDHVYRFNVMYDGTLQCVQERHKADTPAQFGFTPSAGFSERLWMALPGRDDNMVKQGWTDDTAPVLWSEWSWRGVLLRQTVFAHVPGGQAVQSGSEPLFAWVRLSVHDVCEGLPRPATAGFLIKINRQSVRVEMARKYNIAYHPEESRYPGPLIPSTTACGGYSLLEPDGRIRLALPAGQEMTTAWQEKRPTESDVLLHVGMPCVAGRHVDLLIPFLPVDAETCARESALGFDGALQEANAFWSQLPSTAARVEIPEGYITEALRRNLQMAEIDAEKDPTTGRYAQVTGSWSYAFGLWATPNSMTLDFMDRFGHHAAVEKYLELFLQYQGKGQPPGDAYGPHPGFLGVPKDLKSVDWLSDHGAVLWVVSQHGLLTSDDAFAKKWLPAVEKACDFIKDSRAKKGHGGVEGILPGAVATDNRKVMQAVWNDGWNYKGLTTAVRWMEREHHPRAAEFAAEARAYRESFLAALDGAIATLPTWRDAAGRTHPQIPTAVHGQNAGDLWHAFHLDTGPMFLVYAGMLPAEDARMQSALAWFRDGPQTRLFRRDADCWQVACLDHEISSCEPCYSWNLYHSWQTGDRVNFLTGLYSLFAGAMSPQTYTVCETRAGITGITPCLPTGTLACRAMVDDEIAADELHLLRLAPRAWLRRDAETKFANLPTVYGPADLGARLDESGETLVVGLASRFHHAPKRIVLHVAPGLGLRSIQLNGRPLEWNGRDLQVDVTMALAGGK